MTHRALLMAVRLAWRRHGRGGPGDLGGTMNIGNAIGRARKHGVPDSELERAKREAMGFKKYRPDPSRSRRPSRKEMLVALGLPPESRRRSMSGHMTDRYGASTAEFWQKIKHGTAPAHVEARRRLGLVRGDPRRRFHASQGRGIERELFGISHLDPRRKRKSKRGRRRGRR